MSARLRTQAVIALAAGALLVPLSACTTSTNKCTSSGCDISLSGKGSKTTIGSNKVEVKLHESTSGEKARVTIGKAGEMTCEQGKPIELTDATVTCKEVGDDKVKIRVDYKLS